MRLTQPSHLTILVQLRLCGVQTRDSRQQQSPGSRQHSEMWTLLSCPVASLQWAERYLHCTLHSRLANIFLTQSPVSNLLRSLRFHTTFKDAIAIMQNICIVRLKQPDEERGAEHEVCSRAQSGHWSWIRNTRPELIVILCILVSISPAAQLPRCPRSAAAAS